MLKAQDTEYGGILYRSNLEARWAEFFDKNIIRHRYEYCKVDLGIDKYTPDFWLPHFKVWVEIKPFRQSRPHSKCYRLAIETRHPVLLIQGAPSQYVVDIFDHNVRSKFVHRIVVSQGEIKPSKELFNFHDHPVAEDALVLVCPRTHEIVRIKRP